MSAAVLIKVFVQNEAGSNLKNYHDEKTLAFQSARHVSRAYPFPYSFVIGTTAQLLWLKENARPEFVCL